MVERMDADRAARLAAAMRSGAVSGGGLEDVAEDWRRARAEEARLHVARDTLELRVRRQHDELQRLGHQLWDQDQAEKITAGMKDAREAALEARVRRLEEALREADGVLSSDGYPTNTEVRVLIAALLKEPTP